MIWERWRRTLRAQPGLAEPDAFADLIERAPVMALLVDRDLQVIAANAGARAFFSMALEAIPGSLVELTRESRLLEIFRAGRPDGEVRLVHQQRVVRTQLVPGPRAGETLLYLSDVTELRHLETVRQEFVANLSHELKTPITSLRLAAESLLGDPPPADRHRFAQRALREADNLSAIVDNLRQLAEIESSPVALQVSTFGVDELVREAAERLHFDRPLELAIAPGLTVSADRGKLLQALSNLLDNAAKFSPPGSAVEVTAGLGKGELAIAVRDHGPGISPEHWGRVFERFYKVDPARSREVPGSGLGLSITKHLVLAHGGRVWTAAAVGGGQVFAFAVPMP